jgi:hypothetical protein
MTPAGAADPSAPDANHVLTATYRLPRRRPGASLTTRHWLRMVTVRPLFSPLERIHLDARSMVQANLVRGGQQGHGFRVS